MRHIVFVVVNFDALAQASDFRIERRQAVFLCWMLRVPRHQIASRLHAPWQTNWAIEDQAKKLELDSPSLWSASIEPIRPHYRLAFAPGSCDLHVCCCKCRWFGTDKRFSNRRRQVVFLSWMQDSNPGSQTPNHQQTECPLTNRLSYRGWS